MPESHVPSKSIISIHTPVRGVRGALHDLEGLGIASNDTALTAFVHAGVARSSERRFHDAAALEEGLIGLMRQAAPDMGLGDTSLLHLRRVAQQLKDEGHPQALPELLRRTVRSIAADGLGMRGRDAETLQVTLQREWRALVRTAELRRSAAGRLLDHLLSGLPPGNRGADLLIETTLGRLLAAVKADIVKGGGKLGQWGGAKVYHQRSLASANVRVNCSGEVSRRQAAAGWAGE